MVKTIVWMITRSWRAFISWVFNLYYSCAINRDKEGVAIKVAISEMQGDVNSLDKIKYYYTKYFIKYTSDPFIGLLDWQPTMKTFMYRKTDDCDGMAVFYKFLFEWYVRNRKKELGSNATVDLSAQIKLYTFWRKTSLFKRLRKMHVMCVLYYEGKYYLGDYELYIYNSFEEVLEHYAKKYFKGEDVNYTEIDYLRLP